MIQSQYTNNQSNAIIYNIFQQSNKDMHPAAFRSPLKMEELSSPTEPARTADFNRSRTWTQSELYRIAAFLHYNSHKFHSESSKKQCKIFKVMSAFVQTRNVNQCRSYTNKLLKSFGSIQHINSYFKQSLPSYGEAVAKLRQRNQETFKTQTLVQSQDSIQQQSNNNIIADSQRNHSTIIIPQVNRCERNTTQMQQEYQALWWQDQEMALRLGSMLQWAMLVNNFQCLQRII